MRPDHADRNDMLTGLLAVDGERAGFRGQLAAEAGYQGIGDRP